jgi:POTRA domain, FtsQ-type
MSDYAALGASPRVRGAPRGGERKARSAQGSSLGAQGAQSARGAERALFALLVAAALLALAVSAVLILPSALRVTRYEVSGNVFLSREELLSAALIHDKEYFFSIDAARVKAALEAEPRIARADVSKLFPNGLKISVRERKAVAAALASIDGRATAVCIDEEGVAYAEATSEESASVPVLSGIRFEGFRSGTRLPPVVAKLLASLGDIRSSEPALLSAISEIRIVAAGASEGASSGASSGGEPELLIYPLYHRIPVRAGASLDAPTLRSIILVLDVLGTRGIADSVREIDFRSGRVVYRSKEGQSG